MVDVEDVLYTNAIAKSGKSAASWVAEVGTKCGSTPLYKYNNINQSSAHSPTFVCTLKMTACNCRTGEPEYYEITGQGTSKKISQQLTARKFLIKINFMSHLQLHINKLALEGKIKGKENVTLPPIPNPNGASASPPLPPQAPQAPSSPPSPPSPSQNIPAPVPIPAAMDDSGISPLSTQNLKVFCGENDLPEPVFVELSALGPSNARVFSYRCSVGEIVEIVHGSTKKAARKIGSHMLLEKLISTEVNAFPKAPIMAAHLFENGDPPIGPALSYLYSHGCQKVGTNDCKNGFAHIDHKFQLWNDDIIQDLNKRFRKKPEDSIDILKELGAHKNFKIVYTPVDTLKSSKNGSCEDKDEDDEKPPVFLGLFKQSYEHYCFISLETSPLIMLYGGGQNEEDSMLDSAKRALDHLFELILTENTIQLD